MPGKPSHVLRAALRQYVEAYDEHEELAFERGAMRLDDESTVDDDSGGQRFR